MTTHLDVDESGGWYTYEFPTAEGVPCGLPGCTLVHPVVYFGKSNEPWRRHFEHLDKPWLPYTSGYRIHPERYATEREALDAEAALIRGRGRNDPGRPLANDMLNRDNPHRLVFPKTTPVRSRARRPVTPSRPYVPATQVHAASPRQQKALAVATTWAVLSGAGWWGASTYVGLATWRAPLAASVAALLLIALAAVAVAEVRGWWNSRRTRRQRRRLVLRVTALVGFAALAGLLYLTVPHLLAYLPAASR